MAKILNNSVENAGDVATHFGGLLCDLDIGPEDSIPGLVRAIILLAMETSDPEQALDEAAAMLSFPETNEETI